MKIISLVLGLLHTNCYIVYDDATKDAIVIDPATKCEKITDEINKHNLNVKYIVLTHAHFDHIAALDQLAEDTGAKICIGAKDAPSLNDSELNLCNYFRKSSPTSNADIKLTDGDRLSIGDVSLKIIETPGHTCGSVSLFAENALFAGDTLFYESIGRTDFATSNYEEIVDSIKNKIYKLPKETVVYSGHGDTTTVGHEILNNPFIRC